MKYIPAGYSAFRAQLDLSLAAHPEIASPSDVNKFLTDKNTKLLVSFGEITKSKRNYLDTSVIDAFANKTFDRSGTSECLNNCGMVIDSGGYQIQKNKITAKEIIPFTDAYYNYFLKTYKSQIAESFILDVLPPDSNYFASTEEMKKYCHYTYYNALELDDELLKKMIYIHHFGPRDHHEIYIEMLQDLHESFNVYSCGGISHLSSVMNVAPYCLTMCEILHEKLKESNPKFRIHILGEGSFASILLFRLLEVHIKHCYGIDVEVTYDSTTVQNTLLRGRIIYCIDEVKEQIYQLDIRSHLLDSKYNGGDRRDHVYHLYNNFLLKYGMNPLDPALHPVYDNCVSNDMVGHTEYSGRFGRAIHLPAYLYGINVYDTIEGWCDKHIDDIYDSYINPDMSFPFVERVAEFIKKFSTKRRKALDYALTFQNTLDSIRRLGDRPTETLDKLKTEVYTICESVWTKSNFGNHF